MNKKLLSKIGIAVAVTAVAIGSVSAIGVGLYQQPYKAPTKQLYTFNGHQFNTYDDAYQYAQSQIQTETFDSLNQDMWTVNCNNNTYLFQTPDQLNQFLNNQIQTINVMTDVVDPSLNLDGSIKQDNLASYSIDAATNSPYNPEIVHVYEDKDGNCVSDADYNHNQVDTMNSAKDSYLDIHKSYYFNGIYFNSTQDLEQYITTEYVKEFTNYQKANNSVIKIKSPRDSKVLSNPIDFNSNDETLNNQVGTFLMANANEYIQHDSKTQGTNYLVVNNER